MNNQSKHSKLLQLTHQLVKARAIRDKVVEVILSLEPKTPGEIQSMPGYEEKEQVYRTHIMRTNPALLTSGYGRILPSDVFRFSVSGEIDATIASLQKEILGTVFS
jgi:hypothetical protein